MKTIERPFVKVAKFQEIDIISTSGADVIVNPTPVTPGQGEGGASGLDAKSVAPTEAAW